MIDEASDMPSVEDMQFSAGDTIKLQLVAQSGEPVVVALKVIDAPRLKLALGAKMPVMAMVQMGMTRIVEARLPNGALVDIDDAGLVMEQQAQREAAMPLAALSEAEEAAQRSNAVEIVDTPDDLRERLKNAVKAAAGQTRFIKVDDVLRLIDAR